MTVKIFVGNLVEYTDEGKLQALFEKFGEVTEVAVLTKFGFVHMSNEDDAKAAVSALNHTENLGTNLTVQISDKSGGRGGRRVDDYDHTGKNAIKIFVGNLDVPYATEDKLRKLFEKFGKVSECAILTKYGFVHMPSRREANIAVASLHNTDFGDKQIIVELSKGDGRQGGGGRGRDFRGPRYEPYGGGDPYGNAHFNRGPYPHNPRQERDPYFRTQDPYAWDPYAARDPYARHPLPPHKQYHDNGHRAPDRKPMMPMPGPRFSQASVKSGNYGRYADSNKNSNRTPASMPPQPSRVAYRLWSADRKTRKSVVASGFKDLIVKGKDKLGMAIGAAVQLVLADDGTEIDDNESLQHFAKEPLILLGAGEEWIPESSTSSLSCKTDTDLNFGNQQEPSEPMEQNDGMDEEYSEQNTDMPETTEDSTDAASSELTV